MRRAEGNKGAGGSVRKAGTRGWHGSKREGSKHAFASRSKINAHSSRFETRAHWIVAQTLLYLCRLYIQCLLGTRTLFLFSFLFPVPSFLSRSFIFFPSYSLSFSPSLHRILRDQSVSFSRTHSHDHTVRVHRGRMRKGSRMDSETWSRCNCMLIECASEYGIRMETIQFDIPFCLRPSFLRSSSTSFSSSRRFLCIASTPRRSLRSSSSSSSSSSSLRLQRENAATPSTLHEIRKWVCSVPFSFRLSMFVRLFALSSQIFLILRIVFFLARSLVRASPSYIGTRCTSLP